MSKVLIALSGGVDSAVVAERLKSEGHEIEGLFLKMSPLHENAAPAAKNTADALGIPLNIEDATDLFSSVVISDFLSEYSSGRTPNPCIVCNPLVKFKLLYDFAIKNGFEKIATGHWANIAEENGKKYISVAANRKKDQSYMLYRLPKEIIDMLIFPLGSVSDKAEVREIAKNASLPNFSAPDSQEICFVEGDYTEYIKERLKDIRSGCFIGPEGENLGCHKGIIHYTVGQRKGLGVSYNSPLYVKSINAENGNVHLCRSGEEYFSSLYLNKVFFPYEPEEKTFSSSVKVRYSASGEEAEVRVFENGEAEVLFSRPVRAACPGQSAVFYRGNTVIGGGMILNSK
jgi:tRNA-specific 2-thiouridylase